MTAKVGDCTIRHRPRTPFGIDVKNGDLLGRGLSFIGVIGALSDGRAIVDRVSKSVVAVTSELIPATGRLIRPGKGCQLHYRRLRFIDEGGWLRIPVMLEAPGGRHI